MAWRKQETHREEVQAVKAALKAAGIYPLRVCHGRGTGWGWLVINLGEGASPALERQAVEIAQRVTGRSGEYDGEISVLAQGR